MPRERLRDWPQLAYKYRCYLQHPVQQERGCNQEGQNGNVNRLRDFRDFPAAVQAEAQAMRDLWNQLVALWSRNAEEYQRILESSQEVAALLTEQEVARQHWQQAHDAFQQAKIKYRAKAGPLIEPYLAARKERAAVLKECSQRVKNAKAAAKETFRPRLKQLSEQFWEEVGTMTKQSPLYWGNVEFVLQGFQSCLTRFFRGSGKPPKEKRGPVTEFSFRHRFTGGGLPLQHLFRDRGRVAMHLEPPPEAYAKGCPDSLKKQLARVPGAFHIAGISLPFVIMLHRPLPAGAIIKTATLIGEPAQRPYQRLGQGYQANWRYHLVLSCEVPPEGYHKVGADERGTCAIDLNWRVWGDRIRYGYLVDSQGFRKELFLPTYILRDWQRVKEHQERASRLVDNAREQLLSSVFIKEQDWKNLPEEHHRLFESLAQTKGPGRLWQLRVLEKRGLIPGTILHVWADKWSFADRQRHGIHHRLADARSQVYRETAKWLCERYHTIVIESLSLKSLAERDTDQIALARSQQYRQLVGLSFFIEFLKQAATRYHTAIEEKEAAYTTVTCATCGEMTVNNGQLFLECPNGHRTDQDENASNNLLAAL